PFANGDEPPLGLPLRPPFDWSVHEASVELAKWKQRESDDGGGRRGVYNERRSPETTDDDTDERIEQPDREKTSIDAQQRQQDEAGDERSDGRAYRVHQRQRPSCSDLRRQFCSQRRADQRKKHS